MINQYKLHTIHLISNLILKSTVLIGVLILLLGSWTQFHTVLATTVGPANTQDYTITNSPIAKGLLPSPLTLTPRASGSEKTTNTELFILENSNAEKIQGHSLKGNTRSLEKFELLMEQARKQQMKTITEIKRINAEIILQEEKSYQISTNRLQIAQSWSYRINQLTSLEENQTKQQITADLYQIKNLGPNVVTSVKTILNKNSGYRWDENHNKKWIELIDRAEQIKNMMEQREKGYEEKVSRLYYPE